MTKRLTKSDLQAEIDSLKKEKELWATEKRDLQEKIKKERERYSDLVMEKERKTKEVITWQSAYSELLERHRGVEDRMFELRKFLTTSLKYEEVKKLEDLPEEKANKIRKGALDLLLNLERGISSLVGKTIMPMLVRKLGNKDNVDRCLREEHLRKGCR